MVVTLLEVRSIETIRRIKKREVIFHLFNFNWYSYRIKQNYKYPFYHIISIYVSHSSLKLEKGSGSDSDSRSSNSCLLDSADHNGSLKQIRTNSSSESGYNISLSYGYAQKHTKNN